MFNSKNIASTFFLLVTLNFSVGCLRGVSKPKSNSATNQNVDYRVLEIKGNIIEENKNNIWTFPTQKTYEFRACLIGRATNQQLPKGQKFMVIEPNGTAYESFTDDLGCLNWKEIIDFNFASNSMYLKKSRRLRSMGSYKGETQIQLAVNPWSSYRNEPTAEVIDLSRSNIAANQIINESDEELLRRGFVNNDDTASKILLNPKLDFDLIPVRDLKNGKTLKMVLRMKPYIEPKSLRGSPEPFQLTTGRFRVFAQLVSTNVGLNAKQHTLLTPDVLPQEVTVTNSGMLSLTLDFDLIREIHMGRIQLALKLEALSTPYPLKAYEGLHNIGSFRSILETGVATQVEGDFSNKKFNYGQFVSTATGFENLKAQGFARSLNPVYFDYFDPRFVRIKSGETSTQRTLMYRITTIVKDSITGLPVVLQPFKIRKLQTSTEETKSTDENGRLIWNDELSHLYYKPEQYFFPEFEITQLVSGYKFSQKIAVNPWDFGWTFGVDTRGQEAYYQELSERSVNSPEFMIDAFRYQTIRFRYVIDEYLTLNVNKAVVMALDPLVERNTINEGRKFEPLRNGIYLVKIALVKYYLDPFQNNTSLIKIDPSKPNKSVNCPIEDDEDLMKPTPVQAPIAASNDYPEDSSDDNDSTKEPEVGYRLETVSCNGEAKKGQYTTVIKKLLRVQAGRITTPLEFSMRDLRMMSIRSNIMVQLETIDENKLLRDNIVDAKLNKLVEDYYALKTQTMTAEEKAQFLEEKRVLHLAEAEKLKASMSKGLKQINAERDALNLDYAERDRILSGLETRLGSAEAARSSETYKEVINLPEQEFMAKINEARTQLNTLHSRIENYWTGYEKTWKEGQLQAQDDKGLLPIPLEQLSKKPSYYDYLATMQHFLDDFGLGLSVTKNDLDALEVNNYSNNPLTPLVDLNLYIEDSGLAKRTFIGPCTLVANDNMSEMRPTDKIDEAATGRIDNSQEIYVPLLPPANNREFEESAYHDSLIPFKDLHVDDIIPMHIENEKQYEREMKVMSQIGRYVRAFNLEYVSLTDQPLKEFKPDCNLLTDNGECFVTQTENVTAKNEFLNAVNKIDDAQLLSRYFYVRPPHRAKRLNETITRENTLEPLWNRTKRELFGFLPSEDDHWVNGLPYADRGIGNGYHGQSSQFLEDNYSDFSPKVTDKHVKQWLTDGAQNLTLLESLKICSVMTDQISMILRRENLITDRSSIWSTAKKTPEEYLLEYCFSRIHHIDKETVLEDIIKLNDQVAFNNKPIDRVFIDGITFDRRRRVVRTGAYEHKAGKNTNLNVGVGFDVGTYKDTNTVASLGLNGGALLGLPAAGIGAYIGAVAAGPLAPIGAVIGAGVGALAGLVIGQETYSTGHGVTLSTSTNVSMASFLVIQKAEEDIVLEEYEKCLSFQFTPEAINSMHFDHLQLSDGVDSRHLGLREALSRGYFICEGEVTDTPVKVRENYYYVTQHFTAGDMLDDVNLLNHVWLLALRGERDFNTFIKTMQGREIGQEGEKIDQDRLYDYSLSRLSYVYGKILPTFPGMYSIQDPLPIHTGQPRKRGF